MYRRMIFLTTVGLMSLVSTIAAEVVVELVPDNPGPYVGGESLTVDVWLHSEVSFGVTLVYVKFDFTDTDPRLSLDEAFTFDFTSLAYPHYYLQYPELPVPFTANLISCWCPELFLQIPAGGALRIGSVGVELATPPGTYRLEILNTDEPDESLGAQISTGAVCETCPDGGLWRAYTGEITGGTCDFVIPPPIPTLSTWGMTAMGLLLLAAGCVFTRRRPKARSRFVAAIFAVSVSLTLSPDVSAEPAEIPIKLVDIGIDSGLVRATGYGTDPVVVFSQLVGVVDAPWIRLHFEHVQLSGSPSEGTESFLRITSSHDAAVQTMVSQDLVEWTNTSAHFNGDEVLVELLAYPNTGDNRVAIDEAAAGLAPEGGGRGDGICGETDDRQRSSDPRTGRWLWCRNENCTSYIACTAFLF